MPFPGYVAAKLFELLIINVVKDKYFFFPSGLQFGFQSYSKCRGPIHAICASHSM